MNPAVARMMELLDELDGALARVETEATDHVLHVRFAQRMAILIADLRYETDVEPGVAG